MIRLRRLRPAYRTLFMLAFAVILLARVIIPQGWMPSANGQWITICSGMGVETAWVDGDGKLHKDAPESADGDCAFAGGSLAIPEPALPAITGPTRLATAIAPASRLQIGHGLAAPPPPATGPPALI